MTGRYTYINRLRRRESERKGEGRLDRQKQRRKEGGRQKQEGQIDIQIEVTKEGERKTDRNREVRIETDGNRRNDNT